MMIEPCNDEERRDFGYIKCISVKKLKELLDTLPDDYMIYTKTLGHTGNLPIVKDDISIGVVDIGGEYIEYYDDEDNGNAYYVVRGLE